MTLLTAEIRSLRKFNWEALTIEYTFTTTTATQYDLPSDFVRFVHDTAWDRNNQLEMNGPATAQRWQLYKSGVSDAGTRKRYRIRPSNGVKKFELDTAPTSEETLVFEYITDQVFISNASGNPDSTLMSDSDTFILPEDLIISGGVWRFLKRFGMDYSTEFSEHQNLVDQARAADGGSRTLLTVISLHHDKPKNFKDII